MTFNLCHLHLHIQPSYLPLIRWRYFSATGLIVGSLSPDFEYFFKMSVDSIHSHSRLGLFYFDLPVTIVLAILFHQLVKVNLIGNLPAFLQKRFQDTLHFNFLKYLKNNWWIFLYSAIIGAGSHLFWDSFTHNNRFFSRQFSTIYQEHFRSIRRRQLPALLCPSADQHGRGPDHCYTLYRI